MARHGIRANRRREEPKAVIQAPPSFHELTHPVGSAERFLDDAAREALVAVAAGGLPSPRRLAVGAVRAAAKEAERSYPDPLLAEAAKLPQDELLRLAARTEAYRRALDVQDATVGTVSAAMSPVANMVQNQLAAAVSHDTRLVRQAAKAGRSDKDLLDEYRRLVDANRPATTQNWFSRTLYGDGAKRYGELSDLGMMTAKGREAYGNLKARGELLEIGALPDRRFPLKNGKTPGQNYEGAQNLGLLKFNVPLAIDRPDAAVRMSEAAYREKAEARHAAEVQEFREATARAEVREVAERTAAGAAQDAAERARARERNDFLDSIGAGNAGTYQYGPDGVIFTDAGGRTRKASLAEMRSNRDGTAAALRDAGMDADVKEANLLTGKVTTRSFLTGEPRDKRQAAKGGEATAGSAEGEPPLEPAEPAPAGGPRIVINPTTFKNSKDALCVAFNEGFRLWMEATGFEPQSEPTDVQRKFFSDTAYADDELQLRRTILARIATFDTSIKDPTDDQLSETAGFLNAILESDWCKNDWELNSVRKLARAVEAAVGAEPVEPKAEPVEPRAGAPLEARAALGGGETDEDNPATPKPVEAPSDASGGEDLETPEEPADQPYSLVSGSGAVVNYNADGTLAENPVEKPAENPASTPGDNGQNPAENPAQPAANPDAGPAVAQPVAGRRKSPRWPFTKRQA